MKKIYPGAGGQLFEKRKKSPERQHIDEKDISGGRGTIIRK